MGGGFEDRVTITPEKARKIISPSQTHQQLLARNHADERSLAAGNRLDHWKPVVRRLQCLEKENGEEAANDKRHSPERKRRAKRNLARANLWYGRFYLDEAANIDTARIVILCDVQNETKSNLQQSVEGLGFTDANNVTFHDVHDTAQRALIAKLKFALSGSVGANERRQNPTLRLPLLAPPLLNHNETQSG